MTPEPKIRPDMSPREILHACDGWYVSPMCGASFVGPLVGYAARDSKGRQLVGYHYANFAKVEEWPHIMSDYVCKPLRRMVNQRLGYDRFVKCGLPEGGKALAEELARQDGSRFVYPEKVVTKLKTETSREESKLVWGRHQPRSGENVIAIEDTCNNFSTTDKALAIIEERGAKVKGIVCFLNRSPKYRDVYPYQGREIPIIALWNEAMPEYEQDDPVVQKHISSGFVEFDPKKEGWGRLMAAMAA